jgi:hypothetical protein
MSICRAKKTINCRISSNNHINIKNQIVSPNFERRQQSGLLVHRGEGEEERKYTVCKKRSLLEADGTDRGFLSKGWCAVLC